MSGASQKGAADAPPISAPGAGRGRRLSLVGRAALVIVGLWVLIAMIGPFLAPYGESEFIEEDPSGQFYADPGFLPPSAQTPLGTDYLGRDVLSRVLYGARTTIGISLAATLMSYLIGITLGILAAVSRGIVDEALSRLNDAILSFPSLMLGLIFVAAIGTSVPLLIILAGIVAASSVFRIARALAYDVVVMDFVEAARARGEGKWWIVRREILPNVAMPLATDFGIRVVYVVIFISSLSFLGLGVQPPTADWGSMVRENLTGLSGGFSGGALACLAPALAIASLTVPINLIVDDLSAKGGKDIGRRMI